MSGATVSVENQSEAGEYLLRRLPEWMPTDTNSGNFKLVDVIGRAFDRVDADVQTVEEASTVQKANTVEQLQRLAKLVDLPPQEGESVDAFRARVIAEYQQMTSEGTAGEIIKNAATVLEIEPTKIGYKDLTESGVVQLTVPGTALDQVSLSNSEFVSIITEQAAAGFRVEATIRGTFTYITPTDYSNSNFDASRGYDGLNSNGNPKNNGGTYAGLID